MSFITCDQSDENIGRLATWLFRCKTVVERKEILLKLDRDFAIKLIDRIDQLEKQERKKVKLPEFSVKKSVTKLDYFSFTFTPEGIEPFAHLSQLKAISQGIDSEIAYQELVEEFLKPLDVENAMEFLDGGARQYLLNFLDEISILYDGCRDDAEFDVVENGHGAQGYKYSWKIYGAENVQIGMAAAGGNKGTCYVSLSGAGCAALRLDKLYDRLRRMPGSKITRADIALDDYKGQFGVGYYKGLAEQGLFNNGGRNPTYCYIESGHIVKQDKELRSDLKKIGVSAQFVPDRGCTFYVGSRTSGKQVRFYEKDRQLKAKGDEMLHESMMDWVRAEVELRCHNRELPIALLLDLDAYFFWCIPLFTRLNGAF